MGIHLESLNADRASRLNATKEVLHRANLLAYSACLVAQRVVHERVTELAEINLINDPGFDCFCLLEHLRIAQPGKLLRFNEGPTARQNLNLLIKTLLS